MAIDMSDTTKILHKISAALKKDKTTLEVNGNNGAGIHFEKIQNIQERDRLIPISEDEMFGDQLLGHPLIKEIEDIRKAKDRRIYTVDVKGSKKTIKERLQKALKDMKGK